jgi:hypothetical protein
MGCEGHKARKGRIGMNAGFLWESQMKVQDVGGRIISKWILEIQGWMAWTGLIWLRTGTGGGLL